jgi:hypothetical protein
LTDRVILQDSRSLYHAPRSAKIQRIVARVDRTARRKSVVALLFFLVGCAAAIALSWPALSNHGVYHSDVRQSPHWAAYHTTSFRADDMIVEYARFNESPLQNAIYFVGTWFVDLIPLTKYAAVIGFGLATSLFFVVGSAIYNMRVGCLMALFFAFFSNSFEFTAGFFSKFWMIPLLLVAIYVLHTKRWRGLIVLMPFAAVAYPMTAVLIGMVCAVYTVQLFLIDRPASKSLLRSLVVASVLAVSLLGLKYLSPPEFLGPKVPRDALMAWMGGGSSPIVPIPSLLEELLRRFGAPFTLVSAALYLLILRRRVCWEREWTALLLASAVGYLLADALFATLYIPNRYTRYSVVVFLVLWHATQWDRILTRIRAPVWRQAALALMLVVAGVFSTADFRPGDEMTDHGERYMRLCAFIATLPEEIFVAGPPAYLDEVMIQSKRSVLSTFKLNHGWYVDYEAELRERTLAIFDAIYGDDVSRVNALHERYGVTHLVLGRSYFESRLRGEGLKSRYDGVIRERLRGSRRRYLLQDPPRESVVYDDGTYTVLELPL